MENYSEKTAQFLNGMGLNLFELIAVLSKESSPLRNLSQKQQAEFDLYYDKLIEQDYSVHTKGALLEKLSRILFCNSFLRFDVIVRPVQTRLIFLLHGLRMHE